MAYTSQGKQYLSMEKETIYDLFMKPVQRECWRNFYLSANGVTSVGLMHDTKEVALDDIRSGFNYLYTAKVEWEE